jgi:imidazole glycerol phosphate synthase subunit HisF
LISAIGASFGAQAVVVAIDARRDPEAADPVREAQVFVHGGRKPAGSACGGVGARGRSSAARARFC